MTISKKLLFALVLAPNILVITLWRLDVRTRAGRDREFVEANHLARSFPDGTTASARSAPATRARFRPEEPPEEPLERVSISEAERKLLSDRDGHLVPGAFEALRSLRTFAGRVARREGLSSKEAHRLAAGLSVYSFRRVTALDGARPFGAVSPESAETDDPLRQSFLAEVESAFGGRVRGAVESDLAQLPDLAALVRQARGASR